jgi:histidyl-tRNA synthetase
VKSPIVDAKERAAARRRHRDGQQVAGVHAGLIRASSRTLRQATDERRTRALCRADLYLGSSGFNAQMKYADRRGADLCGHSRLRRNGMPARW